MKTDEKNPHKRIIQLEKKIQSQRSEIKTHLLTIARLKSQLKFGEAMGPWLVTFAAIGVCLLMALLVKVTEL